MARGVGTKFPHMDDPATRLRLLGIRPGWTTGTIWNNTVNQRES